MIVDLLRTHLTLALRGGQHRPDRLQGFAEHRRPGSDRLRRPHPAGRLALGHTQHRRQHPPHAALTQHRRQIQPLRGRDDVVIDNRQEVPGSFQVLHELDQPHAAELIETPVADRLDQMLKTRAEHVAGTIELCRLVRPRESHAPILLEHTFDYKSFPL